MTKMTRTYVTKSAHQRIKDRKRLLERKGEEKNIPQIYDELVKNQIREDGTSKLLFTEDDLGQGLLQLIRDLSDEQETPPKDVITNFLKIAMQEIASEEYYVLGMVEDEIERLKARLEKLTSLKEKILREKDGKENNHTRSG